MQSRHRVEIVATAPSINPLSSRIKIRPDVLEKHLHPVFYQPRLAPGGVDDDVGPSQIFIAAGSHENIQIGNHGADIHCVMFQDILPLPPIIRISSATPLAAR